MDTLRGPRKRRVGRSEPLKWRVSDELWAKLEPLLRDPPRRFRYPGRARYSARDCLEGILYVLYTDKPWLRVPYRELGLPSGETCRRRLEEWQRRGLLEAALHVLQQHLAGADRLDWTRVIVDALIARGLRPAELWADRGYASSALEEALRSRQIEPRISRPRRRGEAIPEGVPTREVWRGRRRRLRTPDPLARHRWPVERTNAWLKAKRRIATRRG